MRVWPAAGSAPEDYPEGIPFVPDVEVGIETESDGDIVVMKWWAIQRPLELMQQLLGASVRQGWVLHSDEPPATGDTGSIRSMCFHREGRERVIEALQAGPFSAVTLTQRPLE
jgi:hypothetical protein